MSPATPNEEEVAGVARRCLDDIAQPAVVVAADTPCLDVERLFLKRSDLDALVVEHPDGELRMLTRVAFFRDITGALGYGRALYGRCPVTRLPGSGRSLVLAGATPLLEGGHAVVARRGADRYDDLIVPRPDGVALVSVARLFDHLAELHAHRSLHDPLTGLANRELFLQRLRGALADRDERAAVLFVDIDDFKAVNDSLGHPAGDALLRAIGDRLGGAFGERDTVARFGGDEFAILLTAADERGAHLAAERIALALSRPVVLNHRAVTMRASVGVALQADHREAEDLLRDADLAMYVAKHGGKDGHVMFEPAMHADAIDRLELAQDLGRALDEGQLRLDYQPIIDLASGVLEGVEALLRWDHPTRGQVAPLDFIGIAEASGEIIPIGRWVLDEALGQVATWRSRRPHVAELMISVNVSPRQLERLDFEAEVRAALDRHGIAPERLILEITETELIHDGDATRVQLTALSELGVRIAIDDFGAGFSSLHRLQQMPVSVLKIDKTFVDDLPSPSACGLIKCLLGMADALGVQALAEGIETERQLTQLVNAGCALGQGYHMSRPLRPDAVEALLGVSRAAAGIATAAVGYPRAGRSLAPIGDLSAAWSGGDGGDG